MVLLSVLQALAPLNRWRLTVVHLNHQLRGRSSDADERLVRRTARRLRLPVVVERADVRQFARAHKLSVEMAARGLRHEFLARTAAARGLTRIALAHHADDQVELFFLRLLRGSGPEGLAGMALSNPSPANPKLTLLRPLLELSRQELRDYAAANHIAFRDDATNVCLDFQRNRLRRELLPLLRKHYQPAVNKVVLRAMNILGTEAAFVAEAAQAWLSDLKKTSSGSQAGPKGWPKFDELPLALQRRCIHAQLVQSGLAAGFDLVEHLRRKPGRAVSINSAQTAARDTCGRVVIQNALAPAFGDTSRTLDLGGRGETLFDGLQVSWRVERGGLGRAGWSRNCEYFDAQRVGSPVRLRHWQPGDRFQPIGMPTPVKLQNLFVNQRVPRARRHQLVVATTAGNEIFWVEGLRIAERFKLTNRTIRRLHWASFRF
jgi:tRNA(Ile)-lysidine synthase